MSSGKVQVTLYPAGGMFNKLRKEQIEFKNILVSHFSGYEESNDKREYIYDNLLNRLEVFSWEGDPVNGYAVRQDDDSAYDRIAQKLRDLKKQMSKSKRFRKKKKPVRPKKRKVARKTDSDDEFVPTDVEGENKTNTESDNISLQVEVNCLRELCEMQKTELETLRGLVEQQKSFIEALHSEYGTEIEQTSFRQVSPGPKDNLEAI